MGMVGIASGQTVGLARPSGFGFGLPVSVFWF